jgi:hypothetical protein
LLWRQSHEVVDERCMLVAYVSVCGSYYYVGRSCYLMEASSKAKTAIYPRCCVTSHRASYNEKAQWHGGKGVLWLRKVTQTGLVLKRLIVGYLCLHAILAMR